VLRFLVPAREAAAWETQRLHATIKLVVISFVRKILRAAIRVVIGTLCARPKQKNFVEITVSQTHVQASVIVVSKTVRQVVTI
jgi:hypothetical protein